MNFTLTIDAPELAQAINNLANALEVNPLPTSLPAAETTKKAPAAAKKPAAVTKKEEPKPDPVPETKLETPEPVKEEPKKEATATAEAPGMTLETVRTKLAAFASADKANQVKVKDALQSLGVKKLTDVNPADYGTLLDAIGLSA
ncbi:hypothetical protein [Sporosarcina trichiuri]|uniref:hypothetical protein n=1 Tax=Sporosarcina trichiuri TaxID=3056445 RepID=UPI0025B3802B|nr:hypothetical protein [Sporosarcina sp. 0.2-SM1T-5]WJY27422.1 hypothetical protein QWT68_15495 [Sporosarcina sp. 0.2-SM1T-5]WJY27442.1 hypothetical protein QWT68_00015 [Sporosarcina sp. 0.2-SM1T-5]